MNFSSPVTYSDIPLTFCITSCSKAQKHAHTPPFSSTKIFLQHGYIPCRSCSPIENLFNPPDEILKALHIFENSSEQNISDLSLKKEGIRPEKIRSWFEKHHKLSFQAFQRMVRINKMFQELSQKSASSPKSSYTIKKEDTSDFGSALWMSRFDTPIGSMLACASDKGLCLLEFTDRKMLEIELTDLQKKFKSKILVGENYHIKQTKQEIKEYFEGNRTKFSVTLSITGTPFRKKVWSELRNIPFGQTCSYQRQAKLLGHPSATRAVANADGCNRISIIIPCHRIIGKNGKLTGYGGGLERKKQLLSHEGVKID